MIVQEREESGRWPPVSDESRGKRSGKAKELQVISTGHRSSLEEGDIEATSRAFMTGSEHGQG